MAGYFICNIKHCYYICHVYYILPDVLFFTMFVLVKNNKIQIGVGYIYYLLMVWGFGAQGDPKSSHFWGESEIFKISSFGLSEVFFWIHSN